MTVFWTILLCLAVIFVLCAAYYQVLRKKYFMTHWADEEHWVKTSDLWRLRLCRYCNEDSREPVFLLHSAMSNQFNFVLPQGLSLVDVLVDAGYDCWVVDLRGSRSCIPPFNQRRSDVSTDDYLLSDIPAAIEYIRQATGYGKVHWVGHSQGGMLLYAYELAYGHDTIASGTTLGSPPGFDHVSFRGPHLLLNVLRLWRGLIAFLMRGMAPFYRVVRPKTRYLPLNWDNLAPEVDARAVFNLLEAPPYKAAAELMAWAETKDWRMLDGRLNVCEGLTKLEIPLFAIYGGADPLTPEDAIWDFFEQLPNPDKQLMVLSQENGAQMDYGHVDLCFGVNAIEEVYTPIAEWLDEHPISERYDGQGDGDGQTLVVGPDEVLPEEDLVEESDEPTIAVDRNETENRPKVSVSTKKKAPRKKKTATRKKSTAKKNTTTKKKAAAKKKSANKKKASSKKKSTTRKKPTTDKNSTE